MADQKIQRIDALLRFLCKETLQGQLILEAGSLDVDESRRLEELGAAVMTYETDDEKIVRLRRVFPNRRYDRVDFSRPWSQTLTHGFDIVVALGLLDRLADPEPFLRFVRQIAPILYLDVARNGSIQSVTAMLECMDYIVTPIPHEDSADEDSNLLIALQRQQRHPYFTPVLVHVHIPKCAGSTFKRILSLTFGDRHHNVYSEDPFFVLEPNEVIRTLQKQPNIVSIASHSIRAFPSLLGNRVPLYVTFLRDPLAQFLSYITFLKKNQPHLTITHKQYVPPDCSLMSIRDIAEWLVTNEQDVPFKSNYTVNFLAEATFRNDLNAVSKRLNGNVDFARAMKTLLGGIALELAIEVLERFFFVGLVEEMERSISLLSVKLNAYGLALNCEGFQRENVSGQFLDDVQWLNERDRVGRIVLNSLEKDFHLYNHFKKKLQQ